MPKEMVLEDTLHPEQLSSLYVTLPTRMTTAKPYYSLPQLGQPLGYGHHLVFFNPRIPESRLRADGTDSEFCPPEPFVRRMWAGGKFTWNIPLLSIGAKATAVARVDSVQKKGFDGVKPMVFVNKKIQVYLDGEKFPSVTEERTHVYLPISDEPKVKTRLPRAGE